MGFARGAKAGYEYWSVYISEHDSGRWFSSTAHSNMKASI